ncbi:MAG TPA: A/G-specific adenine glycosylase [Desulfosporosinus sp.]|nr:A/G-specific adenine glycosylase [Desulfosporosinus sp.]
MYASNDSSKDIEDNCLSALLLAWYTVAKRDLPWRRTENPYFVWISEVMLQQTQVKTVIPYYERFLQRFPSVEQLATANLEDVLTIWSGLGYYSRARRMWEGAQYICDQCGGKMPENFDGLLQVPGIGDYTAGAIASIAFGHSVVAIDGNVKRVVSRLLAWPEAVETVRSYRYFRDHLRVWQPVLQPGDFNQALMELGAMVCTPTKPDCGRCPLAQICEGYLRDEVLLYPVKKLKAQRQVVTRLTFVLRRGGQVYLQRRPSQGLLADLWEFPGVELSVDNSAKDSLPIVTDGECFNLYQTVVSERAFEGWVREQFEQGVTLHGPTWYTFSHRRWKIVWAIVDLPDLIDPLNLPGPSESLETGSVGSSLLREMDVGYRSNPRGVQPVEDNWCWVQLQDLSSIPLPVAFRVIVEDLTKLV